MPTRREDAPPSVSVVIPAYNVEKYLEFCVKSVCSQTLTDIEIIIVDDGSTDSSGEIADRLALSDSRIRVIHQENAGLGPARNSGIDAARGDYIGFVDSDDWVDPDMFRRLWVESVRTCSDVCAAGFKVMTGDKTVETNIQPFAGTVLEGADQINRYRLSFYGPKDDTNESQPLVSAWVRLYKRDLLIGKGLRFRNIRSEDVDFNIRVMRDATRITFLGEAMYCYRKDNQSSITNGMNPRIISQYEEFVAALGDCLDDETQEIREECFKRLQRGVYGYMRTLVNVCLLSGAKNHELVEFTRLVLESPVFTAYLVDYPMSNMSLVQRALLFFMIRENAGATAFLFRLKRKVGL